MDDTPFCCTNRRTVGKLNGKSGGGSMFLWRFMGKLLARVTAIYGSNIPVDRSTIRLDNGVIMLHLGATLSKCRRDAVKM